MVLMLFGLSKINILLIFFSWKVLSMVHYLGTQYLDIRLRECKETLCQILN